MVRLQRSLLRVGLLAGLAVLWEGASGRWIDAWMVSSPSAILSRLYEITLVTGEIWPHLQASVTALAVGFPLGIGIGVALGYLLGRNRLLSELLEPLIVAVYGIPKIAFAPLLILWFGIGIASKIALVVMLSFFTNFFNTYAGIRQLDEDYIKFARLMGARGAMVTTGVILPAVSPHILTGVRSSVPLAFIGVIVGEFLASRAGLGLYIRNAVDLFDLTGAFAVVIIFLALIGLLNGLMSRIEQRVLAWMPRREVVGTGA